MAASVFDSMWYHMGRHQFVFECDEDLTCVLCKRLMVDSCQGICGCQYCHQCITRYISGGDAHCPGNKEYCHEVELIFERNLFRNVILDKKISKINVTCPNESCGQKIELFLLDDHLRLCTEQKIECPYVTLGCTSDSGSRQSVEGHLQCDRLAHSGLLVEIIQDLRNEINSVKEKVAQTENGAVNTLLTALRGEIEDLKRENENLVVTVNLLHDANNEESRRKERRIATLEGQWRQFGTGRHDETEVEDVRIDIENMINGLRKDVFDEIRLMKEESSNKDMILATFEAEVSEIMMELKVRLDKVEGTNNEVARERREIEDQIKQLRKSIEKMENDRMKYEDDEKRKMIKWTKWNKLCPNIDVDFVWRIENCSKKINAHLFSESFYTNNYRFCLYLFVSSDDNISLGFYMMRGDKDGSVEWPMLRPVTVSIIDQYTMRTHMFERYQYGTYRGSTVAFERPTTDRNKFYIGTQSFIKYSSIKDKTSIMDNDSLIVTFVLSRPSSV